MFKNWKSFFKHGSKVSFKGNSEKKKRSPVSEREHRWNQRVTSQNESLKYKAQLRKKEKNL